MRRLAKTDPSSAVAEEQGMSDEAVPLVAREFTRIDMHTFFETWLGLL
jgi:hypothetical protein